MRNANVTDAQISTFRREAREARDLMGAYLAATALGLTLSEMYPAESAMHVRGAKRTTRAAARREVEGMILDVATAGY